MKITRRQLNSLIREHLSVNSETSNSFINEAWYSGATHFVSKVGMKLIQKLMKVTRYVEDVNNDGYIDDDDKPYTYVGSGGATVSEISTTVDLIIKKYGGSDVAAGIEACTEDILAALKSLPGIISIAKPFMPDDPIPPPAETFTRILDKMKSVGFDDATIKELRGGITGLIELLIKEFPGLTLAKLVKKAGGSKAYVKS